MGRRWSVAVAGVPNLQLLSNRMELNTSGTYPLRRFSVCIAVASSVHARGVSVGSSGVSIVTAVCNERRITVVGGLALCNAIQGSIWLAYGKHMAHDNAQLPPVVVVWSVCALDIGVGSSNAPSAAAV